MAGADGFGQLDLDLFACLALGHRFGRVAAREKFIGFLAALLVDHDVAGADGFGQLGFDLLAGLSFDDRFGRVAAREKFIGVDSSAKLSQCSR